MKSSFLTIIPARKGSKGIPNKNLTNLLDKPLLEWTLLASKKCSFINKLILSSDSDVILKLGEKYECTSHKRSSDLSNDAATTNDVILKIFDDFSELKKIFSHFILLQPTSPLRTYIHINEACKKIIKEDADSLISVCKTDNNSLKNLFVNEAGKLKTAFRKDFFEMPRQKLPLCFKPNGAIYISKINEYISSQSFLQKKTTYYEMDQNISIDIDNISDVTNAENFLLKNSE
tara:strand:+ start:3811 stop:4506 length:696 start_codon:yes stop_codon:yes gene_type:complete